MLGGMEVHLLCFLLVAVFVKVAVCLPLYLICLSVVNMFIVKLKLLDIGCHIGSVFVGCIMYADDIILLCPS